METKAGGRKSNEMASIWSELEQQDLEDFKCGIIMEIKKCKQNIIELAKIGSTLNTRLVSLLDSLDSIDKRVKEIEMERTKEKEIALAREGAGQVMAKSCGEGEDSQYKGNIEANGGSSGKVVNWSEREVIKLKKMVY